MIWFFFGVFDKMTINLHVRNLRDFIANIIIAQDNFLVWGSLSYYSED